VSAVVSGLVPEALALEPDSAQAVLVPVRVLASEALALVPARESDSAQVVPVLVPGSAQAALATDSASVQAWAQESGWVRGPAEVWGLGVVEVPALALAWVVAAEEAAVLLPVSPPPGRR
jgi:hypothetical protein